jgi:hypothetical protein
MPRLFGSKKLAISPNRALNRKTTIATACRNRAGNLATAIKTWLNAEPAKIVICDWGSDDPVTHDNLNIPHESRDFITIHRVDADRWILSWAFNEALSRVSSEYTLKLDCDHKITKDFFERNIITANSFARGHWRTQRISQQYINGAFFSCTELLRHVGFYDERITTYGWDDSDLYERLYESSILSSTLASGTIEHLDQDEEQRTISQDISGEARLANFLGVKKTTFLIERNRILTRLQWPWDNKCFEERHRIRARFTGDNPKEEGLIEFATIRAFEHFYTQQGQDKFQSAIDAYHVILSQDETAREYRTSAYLSSTILDQYSKACHAKDELQKNILRLCLLATPPTNAVTEQRLRSLHLSEQDSRQRHTDSTSSALPQFGHQNTTKSILSRKPKLFIDAQHGLGNRLRAIASASAIAKATHKELVIIWQTDHHCQARFSDLFNYNGPVEEQSFIEEAAAICDQTYNYMPAEERSCKDREIDLSCIGNLYLRSAFTFNSRVSNWESENLFLRSLKIHEFVRGLVHAIRRPNDISVHVRMAGGKEYEHLPYENQSNWTPKDHKLISEWRMKSHFINFFGRIDDLITKENLSSIFVAADLPDTYVEFLKKFGDRLTWLPRQVNDRSTEQLQFALADAILLSQSNVFLGSTWSSFSELALRLAGPGIRHEMSGIDF